MFNCFSSPGERIKFSSNPPLPDSPLVVADKDEFGNIKNKVVYQPKSNESFFSGIHYSAETMSLRAKLNLGIELKKVPNIDLTQDPTEAQRNMLLVEQQIEQGLNEINAPQETPRETPQELSVIK